MNEIWIIGAVAILFVCFGLAKRGQSTGSCGCAAGVCEGVKKKNLRITCKETHVADDAARCDGKDATQKDNAE